MSAHLCLVDTGILVAAAMSTEPSHQQAVDALQGCCGPRLVPSPVIVETLFLIRRARGNRGAAAWLRGFLATRPAICLVEPSSDDLQRAAGLMDEYADAALDFVDAVIVAIAERLSIRRVLTLDQRDFRLVRPQHCTTFEIAP